MKLSLCRLCKPISGSLHLTLSDRAVTRLKSLQNSGAFLELFWVLLTKTEKVCGIFKKFGSFSGAFLGAFDKYVEILEGKFTKTNIGSVLVGPSVESLLGQN